MSAVVSIQLSPEGRAAIERHKQWAPQVTKAIDTALRMTLVSMENYTKVNLLRGGNWRSPRNGSLPLASRSGALLGAVTHAVDQPPFSGYIGTSANSPAAAYAKVLLGEGTTTIKPKSAKHLWIPIADNLTGSGQMRMSPREAFEHVTTSGKKLLRIFKSKAGNLVAFLPEAREASDVETRQQGYAATGRRYKRGKNKGRQRGKLLFVLKDQVTIKGTGALAQAINAKRDDFEGNLNTELSRVFSA